MKHQITHKCHATGCVKNCRPEYLMCYAHWIMVPPKLRRAVYDAYRDGQCDDKRVSDKWIKAADAAIGYVAALDGQPLRVAEVTALTEHGYETYGTSAAELRKWPSGLGVRRRKIDEQKNKQ